MIDISEVPFGIRISFMYEYDAVPDRNPWTGQIIACCTDTQSKNRVVYAIGFTDEDNWIGRNFISRLALVQPGYFMDDVRFKNHKLLNDFAVIKKNFSGMRWFNGASNPTGKIDCVIIEPYRQQKCASCSIPAPHSGPNHNGQFICKMCEVSKTLCSL